MGGNIEENVHSEFLLWLAVSDAEFFPMPSKYLCTCICKRGHEEHAVLYIYIHCIYYSVYVEVCVYTYEYICVFVCVHIYIYKYKEHILYLRSGLGKFF